MRRPPSSTRSYPLCPYTTRFRSLRIGFAGNGVRRLRRHGPTPQPAPAQAVARQVERGRPRQRIDACGIDARLALPQAQVGVVDHVLAFLRVPQHAVQRVVKRTLDATIRRNELRLRSEEHTSELQSLMSNSYAVF